MRGAFPISSCSLEKQAVEECPADHFCFTHVALGMDFQDKHRERQGGVWGEGAEREKGFLGICAFTLKIKPSKNPVWKKKKTQAGSCIGVLLTRIVNVLGIKKQSRVQYDTSLHAFMSASVRLVLQKLWIELSTRGTIKVVRESSLLELSEQTLGGYLSCSPALFLKTCDLETQLSNQANEIKAPITPRNPPHPP